ncbi:transposase [Wenyingzhuangia sp. IMCC45574]
MLQRDREQAANPIHLNYRSILNYFNNRSTNAATESFNAKIRAFRAQFRGLKNVEFFLFRLTNIYLNTTTRNAPQNPLHQLISG